MRSPRARSRSRARTSPRPSRTSAPRRACSWRSSTRSSIPGVSVANFLRMAINAKREEPIQVKEFRAQLQHAIDLLDVDRSFTSRHLNDGFSGGEKKRAEILQMAMLAPDVAILDETDSGLDIDALRTVAEGVQRLHDEQGLGALIITHYQRILHYVKPEFVHILMDGRIVLEGGVELVERLEREGYDQIRQEVGASAVGPVRRAAPAMSSWRADHGRRRQRPGSGAGQGRAPPRGDALPRAGGRRRGRRAHARRSCARRRCTPTSLELPVWRRSGFWTTSLAELDWRRSRTRARAASPAWSRRSSRAPSPSAPRAGRIVQRGGAVVHVELDPALAERGVILCSLEDALREHARAVREWYSRAPDDRPPQARGRQRRLLERRGVPVRAGRRRRRGPVRDRLRDRRPGRGPVRAHARRRRTARATSACTSTTSREDFADGARRTRAGAARGRVRAVPAGRRPLPAGAGAGLGPRRGVRRLHALVAVGRDAYCHWLPALLGGHLVRQHLELAVERAGRRHGVPRPVLRRGARAPRRCSRWTCTRRARPAATCTGAARRPARAARASRA